MGRPTLTRHRKFFHLARILDQAVQAGFGEILGRGALELVWEASYEAGDDLLGSAEDVEALARWRGEPGALAGALVEAGFLDQDGAGGLRVHDLWDHAPAYVQKRAEREAQRRERGETLSSLRSKAGRAGGIASGQARRSEASGSKREASCFKGEANGATPAPAPAPEKLLLVAAGAEPKKVRATRKPKATSPGTSELCTVLEADWHDITGQPYAVSRVKDLPNLDRARKVHPDDRLRAMWRVAITDGTLRSPITSIAAFCAGWALNRYATHQEVARG